MVAVESYSEKDSLSQAVLAGNYGWMDGDLELGLELLDGITEAAVWYCLSWWLELLERRAGIALAACRNYLSCWLVLIELMAGTPLAGTA